MLLIFGLQVHWQSVLEAWVTFVNPNREKMDLPECTQALESIKNVIYTFLNTHLIILGILSQFHLVMAQNLLYFHQHFL